MSEAYILNFISDQDYADRYELREDMCFHAAPSLHAVYKTLRGALIAREEVLDQIKVDYDVAGISMSDWSLDVGETEEDREFYVWNLSFEDELLAKVVIVKIFIQE
jgi:hypothetical protein